MYLHSEWVPKSQAQKLGASYIVVKDVTKLDEPFIPLYHIYLQTENLKAKDVTKKALDTTFDTLVWYAEKEKLLCVLLLT